MQGNQTVSKMRSSREQTGKPVRKHKIARGNLRAAKRAMQQGE